MKCSISTTHHLRRHPSGTTACTAVPVITVHATKHTSKHVSGRIRLYAEQQRARARAWIARSARGIRACTYRYTLVYLCPVLVSCTTNVFCILYSVFIPTPPYSVYRRRDCMRARARAGGVDDQRAFLYGVGEAVGSAQLAIATYTSSVSKRYVGADAGNLRLRPHGRTC